MRVSTLALLLAACAPEADEVPIPDGPAGDAYRLGLADHLGRAEAASVETTDGVTTTEFTTDSGPRCLRGDSFRAATREGSSDDLLIFLQGGGACWSRFCLAVTKAPAGMPDVDALRTDLEVNPFRDMDVAYAPYCDGSMFSGDAEVDEDGDRKTDRWHAGVANLSATLDLAVERFPSPRRVVLAGSSGGAYGTILGSVLVRAVYPDAEIVVLADSGTGVARGEAEPTYVRDLLGEIGALRFVPPDCPDCLADGHVTGVIDWWLARDPDVRFGVFSAWYDSIIGDVFLQVPPTALRDELAKATGGLHDAWPDRYRRFLIDGRMHTTTLGDPTGIVGTDLSAVELPPESLSLLTDLELGSLSTTASGDRTFAAWAAALVEGDASVWADVVEEAGPAPE